MILREGQSLVIGGDVVQSIGLFVSRELQYYTLGN
jgi:hypothetical protein